jgi:hypothetical protein
VKDWVWEYEFFPNGTVNWRDTRSLEKGSGRWSMGPKLLNLSWNGSTTKESWQLPLGSEQHKRTWYSAPYFTGAYQIQRFVAPAPSSSDDTYNGSEEPIDLSPQVRPPEDNLFYPPIPNPHRGGRTQPIFDDDTKAVIGYMYASDGFSAIYDLSGKLVWSDEEPVETPLLDPIDFIFIVEGVARGIGKAAFELGIRAAASAGSKAIIREVTTAIIGTMRGAFRAVISARTLKFTATTAERMATKGRYVPVHLLKMAIRFGARDADPQGVKGAFQYTLKIIRSEPNIAPGLNPAASWAGRTYTLKVVVKEELISNSNTVLHFHYQ